MKRLAIGVVILLFALNAFATDNLHTIKGFEAAYRRAHDSGKIRQLEALVCWDRTTAQMRRDMRASLQIGLELEIREIQITPLSSGPPPAGPAQRFAAARWGAYTPPKNANLKPTHILVVWYKHEGVVGTRYPIGKKAGKFQIVVSTDWRAVVRMAPVVTGVQIDLTRRCSQPLVAAIPRFTL